MKKALIAYFSCTGTTKKLAEELAAAVYGDLYEIRPVTPYTAADLDWSDPGARSTREMNAAASRPAIAGVPDISGYDVVFVGFPVWWYVAPTIINTFLESADFSGRTVIPFCTSGMSGPGETDNRLRPSCSKNTEWRPAKRFPARTGREELRKWVESLKL